ncbi:MAG: hypothetical protein GPOALKHO_001544 [Sodalis sp.]|nr:MAG: hypothetical protein GPOALKHO_001544 [Sodalis sp.]
MTSLCATSPGQQAVLFCIIWTASLISAWLTHVEFRVADIGESAGRAGDHTARHLPGDSRLLLLSGTMVAKGVMAFSLTLITLSAAAGFGCWLSYLRRDAGLVICVSSEADCPSARPPSPARLQPCLIVTG